MALTCHAATPCEAAHRIEVQVHKTAGATLELRYTLEGDIDGLLIPAQTAPCPADKLWQHTCFEAFVAGGDERAHTLPAEPDVRGERALAEDGFRNGFSAGRVGYYELNFSPSTEWAIYRFSAYREGMTAVEPARPPHICVRREADRLALEAVVDLERLSGLRDGPGLRLSLTAVIEDTRHRLSYWALAHPSGKPDFHHAAGFALVLPGDGSRDLHTGRTR